MATTTYRARHPDDPEWVVETTAAWIAEGFAEDGYRVTATTEAER